MDLGGIVGGVKASRGPRRDSGRGQGKSWIPAQRLVVLREADMKAWGRG